MITFLPFTDFTKTAQCLDRQRLGKQRSEALMILQILHNPDNYRTALQNNPNARMWRGFECTLLEYIREICNEWTSRGYIDNCLAKAEELHKPFCHWSGYPNHEWQSVRLSATPSWLHEESLVCKTHKFALVRKNPAIYSSVFPEINLEDSFQEAIYGKYYWPVKL